MKHLKELLQSVADRLTGMMGANAVVSTPVSLGDSHIIPLCEVSVGFGSGGGVGQSEGDAKGEGTGQGVGGGGGGGARVEPVAVLVIDQNGIRLEHLGR